MPDQEMIDRVAKVLWDKEQSEPYNVYGHSNSLLFGKQWHGKSVPWEYILGPDVVPSIANEYRDKAKLVIETMREPTKYMIKNAYGEIPNCDYQPPKNIWYKMFDAILK